MGSKVTDDVIATKDHDAKDHEPNPFHSFMYNVKGQIHNGREQRKSNESDRRKSHRHSIKNQHRKPQKVWQERCQTIPVEPHLKQRSFSVVVCSLASYLDFFVFSVNK